MINLNGKKVTVFGAGKIAYRKAKSLLECGAAVNVVSKEFIEEFYTLTKDYPHLTLIRGEYEEEFIKGNYLIVGATNSEEANLLLYNKAKSLEVLCNIVDNGDVSDYIVPSVVRRGDLILSVSTSGKSPSLSKKIKEKLEEQYPDELEEYVNLLGKIRERIIYNVKNEKEKKEILNNLVHLSLDELKEIL